jgi:hypothetical protein
MKYYKLLNDLFKKHGITYTIWLVNGHREGFNRFKDFSNIKVIHDSAKVFQNSFNQWYVEVATPEGVYSLKSGPGLKGTSVEAFMYQFLKKYVKDNPDFIDVTENVFTSNVIKNNKNGRFYFNADNLNLLNLSTKDNRVSRNEGINYFRYLNRLNHLFGLKNNDPGIFETLLIKDTVENNINEDDFDITAIDLKPLTPDSVDFTQPNTDPNTVYVIRQGTFYGSFTINDSERDSFETCQATGHYLIGLSNNQNERTTVNDYLYTSAYFNKNSKTCHYCGNHHFDTENNFKLGMCLRCYKRINTDFDSVGITMPDNIDDIKKVLSTVKSYDYNPEFNMLNVKKARSPLYMGVELEVDTGTRYDDQDDYDDEDEDNRYDSGRNYTREKHNLIAARALNIMSPEGNAYTMWDGSLINGFEIATHPATLESHLKAFDYETAFKYLKSKGYTSHDSGTCGLHVHIGRRFFGKTKEVQLTGIGKLAYLVEKHWDRFVAFSRRNHDQLDQWARPSNILDYLDTSSDDDRNAALAVQRTYGIRGKYSAVNLQHRNTVELRMFRGTLNYNTFIATLTMVDGLARLAKKLSLKELTFINFNDIINYSGSEIVKNYWNTKEGD